MQTETFYDENSATLTPVVIDEASKACAIIDTVPDYDQYAGTWSTQSADKAAQIKPDTSMTEYIAMREARDATLAVPKLLFPSLRTNMHNGQFGPVVANAKQFIKVPLNVI